MRLSSGLHSNAGKNHGHVGLQNLGRATQGDALASKVQVVRTRLTTLTYQNLQKSRVPINSIFCFVIRTYKKVGFGRLR